MQSIIISEDLLKNIRKFIYDSFIEKSHAPVIENIQEKFSITRKEAIQGLDILHQRHLIVKQPFTNRILMAHPFSNIATAWVVKPSHDTVFYANCAWDAVAMHFTLHNDLDIESFCLYCNTKINIRLEKGTFKEKIPSTTLIVISKPASKWWDNVIDTCANHMNFFCKEEHVTKWREETNIKKEQIGIFTDETVIELSKFLYNTKIQLNYQRPTEDEEKQKFTELHLVEDFWNI